MINDNLFLQFQDKETEELKKLLIDFSLLGEKSLEVEIILNILAERETE